MARDAAGGVGHDLADEHLGELGISRHRARDVDRHRPRWRLLR